MGKTARERAISCSYDIYFSEMRSDPGELKKHSHGKDSEREGNLSLM